MVIASLFKRKNVDIMDSSEDDGHFLKINL